MSNITFQDLSPEQMTNATGGNAVTSAAKFVAKKIPILGWAWTAFDAAKGFIDARNEGKSVGESLANAGQKAIW